MRTAWRAGRTWPSSRSAPQAGRARGGRGGRPRFRGAGFLGATMQPGIELMLDLLSFDSHLSGARLVITGEGALDAQTLHGKAPAGVARAAAAAAPDLPVVAVAGAPADPRPAPRGRHRARLRACRHRAGPRPLPRAGRPLLEDLAGLLARDWIAP